MAASDATPPVLRALQARQAPSAAQERRVPQAAHELRASDADREQAVRALRDGSVEGRLSHETFIRRVDVALRARGTGELAELLSDLPPSGRITRFAARAVASWSAFTVQLRLAWRIPRLPRLVLPPADTAVLTIGRAGDCDLVLPDLSVSSHHAQLHRAGDELVLVDLSSTNGTRVNGWRVASQATVRPGDWVTFGRVGFHLVDQPPRLRRRRTGLA
jgi:hypothetical protein